MERAANRAERLRQIEAILLESRQPLTRAEIARQVHVHRSTIARDLASIPNIYETTDGCVAIDRKAYLVDVRFSLNEALALHLAARMLVTRMDRRNPHAASAVRRLGIAIQNLAPTISRHLLSSAEAMSARDQWTDPAYIDTLEKLTEGWAAGRKVHIWHRSDKDGELREYTFSPYFIEPYAIGQTTYAIGWSEPQDGLRTYKIERIDRAELLPDAYTVPASFDPDTLLEDAWGIWFTGEEPVDVVLCFSPRVARRVQENRWHRSHHIVSLPDGRVLWRARVAAPQEMYPWVRSWGVEVEVLEPAWMRERLMGEIQEMAALYAVIQSEV